jgi:hypothetical protein
MQAPSDRTFSRLGVIPVGERMMPGEPLLSDSERAVWIGEGRVAHYRQKAAHFKELASVEFQPRARAQLLGLASEYDQLAETRIPKPSGSSPLTRAGNE